MTSGERPKKHVAKITMGDDTTWPLSAALSQIARRAASAAL
jgi:hypothetical protein